jgi:glycolate oxidase iron-sulfur subunit
MALIQAVLDGELAVSGIFKDRLATCAGCLACEASCPSGVPVTEIIQAAKEQAIAEGGAGIINRLVAGVMQRPALFRASHRLAPAMLHFTGEKRSEFSVRGSKFVRPHGKLDETRRKHKKNGTVVFFPGCAVENFQPEIGKATIAVLHALGYDVVIPEGLKCCGRPLLSLGDRKAAEELAEHNRALLTGIGADVIVTACASCGLTFKKDYPTLLRPGRQAPAILDIHEFLAPRIPGFALGPLDASVTWHDPCHLGRGQGLTEIPRDILRSVPGLLLVEMIDADRCCGFGGVMRITRHRLSDGIAEEKALRIIATKADAVVTGCPGCRMQLSHALARAGSGIEALHTVQVLEAALAVAEQPEGERVGR